MNSTETPHYLFATSARSIQSYALAGNKLRDMIGASALIEGLAGSGNDSLLERTLKATCNSGSEPVFARRQGGSIAILFEDEGDCHRFASAWSAATSVHVPGLQVDSVLVPMKSGLREALEKAHEALIRERNRLTPELPAASPLAERSGRTGFPVTEILRHKDEDETLDLRQVRKRQSAKADRNGFLEKVLPENLKDPFSPESWPVEFDEIAGQGERSYVALLHADGNSLGEIVRKLGDSLEGKPPKEGARTLLAFSDAIDASTLEAVNSTLRELSENHWAEIENQDRPYPFRPIVCAGDDFTAMLRAEDGIEFAQSFLRLFEETSRLRFAKLREEGLDLPTHLVAAAGIAYVKPHFPFHLAYGLCESLCKEAKRKTNRKAAALAFHRVTTSSTEEYEQALQREYRFGNRLLTMNPYLAGSDSIEGLPTLAQLRRYRETGRKLPRGALRETARAATISRELAERRMERAKDVAEKKAWTEFENAWRAFPGNEGDSLIWKELADEPGEFRTPLLDALDLDALENSRTKTTNSKEDQ